MGRMFAMLGVLALALLGGFAGGSTPAQAAPSAFLALGELTDPPRGFTEMCTNLADVCNGFARGFARQDFAAPMPAQPQLVFYGPFAAYAPPVVTAELASTRISLRFAPAELLPTCGIETPLACLGEGAPMPRVADSGTGTSALATEPPVSASAQIPENLGADERADRSLLARVNNHVNGRVHQQSDMASYGVPELWRPSGDGPHAVGDCEDLAIEKRIELIAAHFPADRLFFAVVYASGVGLHTVLVARLDSGDVVLDSRSAFIQPWSRTPYSWLSIEAPGAPLQWHQSA